MRFAQTAGALFVSYLFPWFFLITCLAYDTACWFLLRGVIIFESTLRLKVAYTQLVPLGKASELSFLTVCLPLLVRLFLATVLGTRLSNNSLQLAASGVELKFCEQTGLRMLGAPASPASCTVVKLLFYRRKALWRKVASVLLTTLTRNLASPAWSGRE